MPGLRLDESPQAIRRRFLESSDLPLMQPLIKLCRESKVVLFQQMEYQWRRSSRVGSRAPFLARRDSGFHSVLAGGFGEPSPETFDHHLLGEPSRTIHSSADRPNAKLWRNSTAAPTRCLLKKQVIELAPSACSEHDLARSRPEIMVRSGNKVGKYFRINSASHVAA